jgi:hypothetical protein
LAGIAFLFWLHVGIRCLQADCQIAANLTTLFWHSLFLQMTEPAGVSGWRRNSRGLMPESECRKHSTLFSSHVEISTVSQMDRLPSNGWIEAPLALSHRDGESG